jgi:hypothetical protein
MTFMKRVGRINVHAAVAAIICFSGSTGAQAASAADSILFAGVAFLDAPDRFPVARALIENIDRSGVPLNRVVLEALRRANIPIRLSLENSLRATALAFAFDDEYRIVERYGGSALKITTGISAQLLSIDFDGQVVKSAFPFLYEYVDVVEEEPGSDYAKQVASVMAPAFLDTTRAGVFQELIEMMQSLPSIDARCTARIMAIHPDTGTWSAARTRFGADSARMIRQLGAVLSRQLTTTARFPLLPMGDSRARAAMQARFANGEIYRLAIPTPDYDLIIDDFRTRRATVGRSASRRVDATGIQYALRVKALDSPVAAGEFRFVMLDTIPANKATSDPWGDVVSATKILTARIGTNTLRREKKWYDENELTKTAFPALPDWLLSKCVRQ